MTSCSSYHVSKNCFSRPYGKSTETIKLKSFSADTIGVFETGHFILYFNVAEYVRNIQEQVRFCKTDSTNFSKIPIPFDSTVYESSSYRSSLSYAMQTNKTDIIIYERLLKIVQTQLKLSDTIYFNKLPPFDKQNFNPKEYDKTNYHAEDILYFAVTTGVFKLYNKKAKLFEEKIVYKMKHNIFYDYDRVYTQDNKFVYGL